jgi:anti-anti-sigma factor
MTSDAPRSPERGKRTAAGPAGTVPSADRGTEQILDQPLDGDSLYQLRASVAAHAVLAGLPQRRADDLVIAAHELAANVVRHGSGRGRLRIWRHDQTLHCQVTDDGSAPGPDTGGMRAAEASALSTADPSSWRVEPGHGLWLVRQLADSLSLHSGHAGPAVTMSFALSGAARVRPFTLVEHASDGSTELAVSGQLDHHSAEQLTGAIDRLLARDPAASLVIDLAGLTFWDAFGLAGLLRTQGRVRASQGASLRLARTPPQLAEHLRETGLASQFTFA